MKRSAEATGRVMAFYGVSPPQPLTCVDYAVPLARDAASWLPTGLLDPIQRILFKPGPEDRSIPSRNLDVYAMTLTPEGRNIGLNPNARRLDVFFF